MSATPSVDKPYALVRTTFYRNPTWTAQYGHQDRLLARFPQHARNRCKLCGVARQAHERRLSERADRVRSSGRKKPRTNSTDPVTLKLTYATLRAAACNRCPIAYYIHNSRQLLHCHQDSLGELWLFWFSSGPLVSWCYHPEDDTVSPDCLFYLPSHDLSIDQVSEEGLPSFTRQYDGSSKESQQIRSVFRLKQLLRPHGPTVLCETWHLASFNEWHTLSSNILKRMEQARKWIDICIATHRECRSQTSLIPERLLRIKSHGDERFSLTLVNASEVEDAQNISYACLSYCWGGNQEFVLSSETESLLRAGFSAMLLPKTLRDAVWVTHQLSLSYLWIDALCIIQNDGEDWRKQASQMGEIFGNSTVTIAATRAVNTHMGFLQPPEAANRTVTTSVCDPGGQEQAVAARRPIDHTPFFFHETKGHSGHLPLLSRAWCLQERILPTRVIHFADQEMVWECCEGLDCECDLIDNWSSALLYSWRSSCDHNKITSRKYMFRRQGEFCDIVGWTGMVQQYVALQLTFEADRLIALGGLVTYLSGAFGRYLAGHWEKELPWSLAWTTVDARRPLDYRAPSWSWASLEHSTFDTLVPKEGGSSLEWGVEVVAAECSSEQPHKSHGITAGYISLRAPVIEKEVSNRATHLWLGLSFSDTSWDVTQPPAGSTILIVAVYKFELSEFDGLNDNPVFCLLCERDSDSAGDEPESYRRIGSICLSDKQYDRIDFEERTVRLV